MDDHETLVQHVHALVAAQGPVSMTQLARLLHVYDGKLHREELAAIMLLIDAHKVHVTGGQLEVVHDVP